MSLTSTGVLLSHLEPKSQEGHRQAGEDPNINSKVCDESTVEQGTWQCHHYAIRAGMVKPGSQKEEGRGGT